MPEITMTDAEALRFWRKRAKLSQRSATVLQKTNVANVEVLIAMEQGKVTVSKEVFNAMIEIYRTKADNAAS